MLVVELRICQIIIRTLYLSWIEQHWSRRAAQLCCQFLSHRLPSSVPCLGRLGWPASDSDRNTRLTIPWFTNHLLLNFFFLGQYKTTYFLLILLPHIHTRHVRDFNDLRPVRVNWLVISQWMCEIYLSQLFMMICVGCLNTLFLRTEYCVYAVYAHSRHVFVCVCVCLTTEANILMKLN